MKSLKKAKGQSIVEYALILSLVSIVCVASLDKIDEGIQTAVTKVNGALSGSSGSNTPPIVANTPAEVAPVAVVQ